MVGLYCLHKVFVADAYRGKGLGAELMRVCLDETDAKHADSFLTVNPTNAAAINLYKVRKTPSWRRSWANFSPL